MLGSKNRIGISSQEIQVSWAGHFRRDLGGLVGKGGEGEELSSAGAETGIFRKGYGGKV